MAAASTSAASAGPPPSQPLAHRNRHGVVVPITWPPAHLRGLLQTDDANDSLLMLICGALAAVSNRALCPKEIAEICMARGWTCSGSQPFAIVSSSIRAHLRRRGIGTANASNGQSASPGLPPPLFTSYELSGPVTDEDALAMGIDAHAKPAVKRGVLWFLSEAGTGYPSPFGARHAELASQQAERQRKRQIEADIARQKSELAAAEAAAAAEMLVREGRSYGVDGLGRGKRKRFASSIAGGDPEWEAGAANALAITTKPRSASEEAAYDPAAPRRPRANSASSPGASAQPTVTGSNGRRIKIRLGSTETTRPAVPRLSAIPRSMHRTLAHDGSSATEDDDEDEEAKEAQLMLARRKKLRTLSESNVGGGRPAIFASRLSLSTVPSFRIGSAGTSVHEEDEDEEMIDLDDSASLISPPAPSSTPTTSVPGPMGVLSTELEFEFEFAFREDEAETPGPDEELSVDLVPLRLDEVDVDTPATTPRSSAEDDETATACEQLKATAEPESTLCPARPAADRARSRSVERVPVRAMSEGPIEPSARPSHSTARSEGDVNELVHDPIGGTVLVPSSHVVAVASVRTLGFAPAHPHSATHEHDDAAAMEIDEGGSSVADLLEHLDEHSVDGAFASMAPLRSAVSAPPALPASGEMDMDEAAAALSDVDFGGTPRSSVDDDEDDRQQPRRMSLLAPEEVTLDELELAFGGESGGCGGERTGLALTAEALEAVAAFSATSPPPFIAVGEEAIVISSPVMSEAEDDDEPAPPSPPRTRSRAARGGRAKAVPAPTPRSTRQPRVSRVRTPSPPVELTPTRTRRGGRRSTAAA